ncbi:MAG: hypothetical protein OXC91_12870 [Rhodobacteraceae bacterium]|nr:hypothetical protein [Paracoccaceae bacterium]
MHGGHGQGRERAIKSQEHGNALSVAGIRALAKVLAGLGLGILVPGCGGVPIEDEGAGALRLKAAGAVAEFERYGLDGAGAVIPDAGSDDPVGDDALPGVLVDEDAIYLATRNELSPEGLLARLERMTGLVHVFLAGPDQAIGAGAGGEGDGAGAGHVYAGGLGDVLDEIANRYDLEWRYRDERVEVREYVTRAYRLPVLPKQFASSRTVGTVSIATQMDPAVEIIEAIRGMAGDGVEMAYAGGTGMLIVKARPSAQREIARHIGRIEGDLEQQLAFDIHVLTVSDTSERGSGAALTLDALGDDARIRWSSDAGLVKPVETFNVGITGSDFKLDLLVSALDRHGEVTVETRTGATTSNNQMVPIQVVRETAYVRQINTTPDTEGNRVTSVEPGNLTTGFEMHLYPRVLDGERVMLNYSIKISELDRLDDFRSQSSAIQLPSVSTTIFEQQTILGDGETLVLAGFERDRTADDRSRGILFTGTSTRKVDHVATVILIRARILGRRLDGRTAA